LNKLLARTDNLTTRSWKNKEIDSMKKLLFAAIALVALAGGPEKAHAQFGLSVVYDPTNFHNAVLRYYQLIAQLNQMRMTYAQIVNQYNLAVQMAQSMPNMATRYATTWAPWRYATAQDAYGNSSAWVNGVNTGGVPNVLDGYSRATNSLLTYSPALLSTMPAPQRQRIESDAATIELGDGAAQNALETIGAIRANAASALNAINNIQNDSFSTNPNLNAEVSVLNKVNATNVLALQNAQDTNKLLMAMLEQQTIIAKQARDSSANITNSDIDRRLNSVGLHQQLTAGVGQTLNTYRLP
jgi:hypothetical protein